MMMRLILPVILFFTSVSAFTQYESLASGNESSLAIILNKAQELNKAYVSWETSKGTNYHKFLLLDKHFGPISFEHPELSMLLKMGADFKMPLSVNAQKNLSLWADAFEPSLFKGNERREVENAKKIFTDLTNFVQSLKGVEAYELVKRYESSNYKVWKSLKTRTMHFSSELVHFAGAIIIVRMITCFGHNSLAGVMNHAMTWQNPAAEDDPVCVDEIMQMLKDPVFFSGFAMFVAGSAVANALIMKILAKIDPDRGLRTQRFERNWVPHLAMMIGFMSDHTFRKIVDTPYLLECAQVGIPNAFKKLYRTTVTDNPYSLLSLANHLKKTKKLQTQKEVIDGEEFEAFGFMNLIEALNPTPPTEPITVATARSEEDQAILPDEIANAPIESCQKAAQSLTSPHLWKMELGAGFAGLFATTAIIGMGNKKLAKWGQTLSQVELPSIEREKRISRVIWNRAKKKTGVQKLVNTSKIGLEKLVERYPWVVHGKTGAVGVTRFFGHSAKVAANFAGGHIKGLARMAVFFGLMEIINPKIEDTYYEGFFANAVDKKGLRLAKQSWAFHPEVDEEEARKVKEFNIRTLKETEEKLRLFRPGTGVGTLPEKKCPDFNSGLDENGKPGICTDLPLVSDIETFHDYSRTWRSDSILKEFNMTYGRWLNLLSSFINNYMYSQATLSKLFSTREMYYNYVEKIESGEHPEDIQAEDYFSDAEWRQRSQIDKHIKKVLQDHFPNKEARDRVYSYLKNEFNTWNLVEDYESPISNSDNHPLKEIWRGLHEKEFRKELVEDLPYGIPFRSLTVGDNEDLETVLADLRKDIHAFVKDSFAQRSSWIDIEANFLHNQFIQFARENKVMQDLLQEIGESEYAYNALDLRVVDKLVHQNGISMNEVDLEKLSWGLLIFQEWAKAMVGMMPKMQEEREGSGIEHSRNPRGMTTSQYLRYRRILDRVSSMDPIYPWEVDYRYFIIGDEISKGNGQFLTGEQEKSEIDSQFTNVSQGLGTDTLAYFVLTQLACGKNSHYTDQLGENAGVALHFQFPHVTNFPMCKTLQVPLIEDGERPSPYRSLFLTPEGQRMGLHQQIIRGEERPLLFRKEADGALWWNESIKPPSLAVLDQFAKGFPKIAEEHFFPKLSISDIAPDRFWPKTVQWLKSLFGGQSRDQQQITGSTAVGSLTLSMLNEVGHYRRIIEKLATTSEWTRLGPMFTQYSNCIVQLLHSLPEKKYRDTLPWCDSAIVSVINSFSQLGETPDGKFPFWYADPTIIDLASTAASDLSAEERRIFIMRVIQHKMIGLLSEIKRYNESINETFEFDLKSLDVIE